MRIRINFPVLIGFALLMVCALEPAKAQQAGATTVATCGSVSYTAGRLYPPTQTQTGLTCGSATVTPGGTQDVNLVQTGGVTQLRGAGAVGTGSERVAVGQDTTTIAGSAPGTAGTASANVITVQGIASGTNLPVSQGTAANLNATVVGTGTFATQATTSPGVRTIIALDVSTVTTGGAAVTALTAGHRSAGGFLLNPIGATINLCINEQGAASGTTSAGPLTCILPGQSYTLSPTSGAVSVITSDSSHPFSGYGLN